MSADDTRRSILISGAGSGIGQAIARYFGERGWFVGVTDISDAGMDETMELVPGGFKYFHPLDVRNHAAWEAVLAAFKVAAGGRVDVVVNNAGIGTGGPIHELDYEELDRCLDINLRGVLYGAKAAYPYLKETAPGSALINIASAAGITGGSGMSVYSATKFGVRGITESLDAEWAPDGITVADICPSFIDTPLLEGTGHRGSNETVRARVTAAGLEITPVEEVAKTVWEAVHGTDVHYLVGKTAKKLNFAKRWMPGKIRKQQRGNAGLLGR